MERFRIVIINRLKCHLYKVIRKTVVLDWFLDPVAIKNLSFVFLN